jgi:peptidoglycan/LPS O-acetylase OafA/YrhL
LSCEFWISVAFAFLIRKRIPSLILLAVGGWGQLLLFTMGGMWMAHTTQRRTAGMVRCSSSFVLGMFSHSVYVNMQSVPIPFFKAHPTVIEVTLCVLMYLIVWVRAQGPGNAFDFCGPPVFVMTVVCFAFEAGYLSKALRNGVFLGTISYSIYLTHSSILLWLDRHDAYFAHVKKENFKAQGVIPEEDYYKCFNHLCYVVLPFSACTYFLWEKPTTWLLRKLVDYLLTGNACSTEFQGVNENAQA